MEFIKLYMYVLVCVSLCANIFHWKKKPSSMFQIVVVFYINSTVCGTRRVCLIIDEQERDKLRLQQLATERGVDVQFRQLGAGDYLWILSPPMDSPTLRYTQLQPTQEKVQVSDLPRLGH